MHCEWFHFNSIKSKFANSEAFQSIVFRDSISFSHWEHELSSNQTLLQNKEGRDVKIWHEEKKLPKLNRLTDSAI